MMRFFVSSLFVMCQAAEQAADEDALSLLQTRMGANESAEVDHDLDRALEGKGPPPPRRRRRAPPPPTPSPTPLCNGIQLNQFAGETFTVSQTSTYYGQNTYTYDIEIGGSITQRTSNAGSYFLGSHSQYGDMIEYFRNGQKCGNTPRQADVTFTVGPTMELLSAQETSMCVYKFTIQLPESKCGLPMTDLGGLDANNDDGEDESTAEIQAEENNEHSCTNWCYSKKHISKCWQKTAGQKEFKCGWFKCSACPECAQPTACGTRL